MILSRETILLTGSADVDAFFHRAATLCARNVAPDGVEWRVPGDGAEDQHDLFAAESPPQTTEAIAPAVVPEAFRDLAERLLLHADPSRFALAYRLLCRLRDAPRLLSNPADADVARAAGMAKAVRRDMHKMTAFLRFRRVDAPDGGEAFVAWFEPDHHIVEATAPFFMRRFANMRWSILTPRRSAHWDGESLAFAPGAERRNAPDGDALENAWRAYFAAIFNPARLNLKAMTREMPKKYWRNLPEADLIAPLARHAAARSAGMIDAAPTTARRGAPAAPGRTRVEAVQCDSLAELARALTSCVNCDLWRHATQAVPGEGAEGARLVFVGEQPGDEEDLSGRPFVGRAGRLLDTAFERAGIERADCYVTNAVKHFRFEPRGKRRIHKKPGAREIAACNGWLARELELVRPRLVVALGASAATALLGRATALKDVRGQTLTLANGLKMRATVHPSFLLRLTDEASKRREWRIFLADLREVAAFVEA